MVDWINSWLRGIIVAVIISTIIEMIIPNGNIKKYIKTVIGVYIVFAIISPIISKVIGKDINISKYINSQGQKYQTQETVTIDTNSYIEQTYIENIKTEIIKSVEEKGYKVNQIQIEIEEEETEYGKLKQIDLQISKNISNIEPVEISVNKQEDNKKEDIGEKEIQEIKEFLATTYGVEQQNITIN